MYLISEYFSRQGAVNIKSV